MMPAKEYFCRLYVYATIKAYNEIRPHSSCDYLTPNQAHLQSGNLKKRWKNYNKKFNYEKAVV
jgi:putative transposase